MIAASIILLSYLLVLLRLNSGVNTTQSTPSKHDSYASVSVIIPFRNESQNLLNTLDALKQLDDKVVEFIFIDDHSTDESYSLVESELSSIENPSQLIKLKEGTGKKAALFMANTLSKSEFSIQLDADCLPPKNWISGIKKALREKPDLLILPVMVDSRTNKWFQSLEFSALQYITFGMFGNRKPILCNGANLAYNRKKWLAVYPKIDNGKTSGDDIFLLQETLKQNGLISGILKPEVAVHTKPLSSTKEFFAQRIRWSGKNSKVQIPNYKSMMFCFGFVHVSALLIFVLHPIIGIPFFTSKTVMEFIFISEFRKKLNQKTNLFTFMLSSAMMPFYLIVLLFASVFIQPGWKDRKIKQ